jgi:hypothetical protein
MNSETVTRLPHLRKTKIVIARDGFPDIWMRPPGAPQRQAPRARLHGAWAP